MAVGSLTLSPPYELRIVLTFPHKRKGRTPMAKQKPTSRAAAGTAAQKKSPARDAAKTTSRKPVKSKARAVVAAKPRRPKQRVAVSHHREADFRTNGLRAYAQ